MALFPTTQSRIILLDYGVWPNINLNSQNIILNWLSKQKAKGLKTGVLFSGLTLINSNRSLVQCPLVKQDHTQNSYAYSLVQT